MLLVLILYLWFHTSHAFFFPMLGGASNCQCQSSCNSPPPPMGCFCPSRAMSECPSAPAYTPQVYAAPQTQIPYPSYVAPPPPQPIQPPPVVVPQPQRQLPLPPPPPPEPLGYGSQQQYVQSLQQVNLQPPTELQTEYMNQLLKALDSSTAIATTKEYVEQPVQPAITTTTSKPINYIPYSAGKAAIRTTEIKLIQRPYVENSSNNKVVETTQKSQVRPSLYNHETHRGEGPTTPEINESGYEFTGSSSSLPPITLDYLQTASRAKTEIEAFTADVDKYHKNSGSTVPLPSSTSYGATVAPPSQGSGYARDPRHLEEEEQRNSSENQIYDELTYEDSGESTPPPKLKQKDQTISKCNSAKLKEAMAKKMTLSPAISKQMIYSAAAELYPGRTVNVICSKHSFSYIVVTSPIFCEHRKRPLTCFAFFQP